MFNEKNKKSTCKHIVIKLLIAEGKKKIFKQQMKFDTLYTVEW